MLGQPTERNEKQHNVFAYVSVEDTREKTNPRKKKQPKPKPKPLHGRICKCNLTKACLAGGVTLAEVQMILAKFIAFLFIFHDAYFLCYLVILPADCQVCC